MGSWVGQVVAMSDKKSTVGELAVEINPPHQS